MFKNPGFYGERGCLWFLLEGAVMLYAVLCLVVGNIRDLHGWF